MTQSPLHPRRLLTRVAEPAEEPVTLAEAKLFLRIDADDEDALIADLIKAARVSAEEYLQRSLVTQDWRLAFNDYSGMCVRLPRGPVSAVLSVSAIDRAGVSTVISDAVYWLDAVKDAVHFDAPVAAHRVEITYRAGFGDAGNVPAPLKQGICAHVAALFDQRGEEVAGLPQQSMGLYAPFREVRV